MKHQFSYMWNVPIGAASENPKYVQYNFYFTDFILLLAKSSLHGKI
jgi:hypothetical protein